MRAEASGTLQGLLHLPFLNQPWISAEQDIRHLPSVELRRAGIYGRRHKPVLETVAEGRCLVCQCPGNESHDGIRKQCGRNLSPADHIVSD